MPACTLAASPARAKLCALLSAYLSAMKRGQTWRQVRQRSEERKSRFVTDRFDHVQSFLTGGGEMGRRMRGEDWAKTPFGPPEHWPEALRTIVSVILNSPLLGTVLWGPELRMLYNDAYAPALAERHPMRLAARSLKFGGRSGTRWHPHFFACGRPVSRCFRAVFLCRCCGVASPS